MRAHKVDANQLNIIHWLQYIGATVLDLSFVGAGCPDLLVGWHGVNYLIEVKNLEGRGMRFTEAEDKFMENWRGQKAVVTGIEEVEALLEWEAVEI